MKCSWSFAFLLCVCRACDFGCCAARVRLAVGDIEGVVYLTASGRKVYSFLGVPYGEPPVGEKRFETSKPARPWPGLRLANKSESVCLQYGTLDPDASDKVQGSEDCLYLNIFTPSLSNTSNIPVLVYFHGGGFMYGNGNGYKPDFLLLHYDVVFVTVNYRLGPFGFLSTEDKVVPGNNGLKDQVLALKWVQDHIGSFGGDKRRVTISGNSAGGASVQYHFLSPFSRGLFHRGISSSGSPLMPWAFTEAPLMKARRLAIAVGCPTSSTTKLVECLRKIPGKKIVELIDPLYMAWHFHPFSPFGPVVDNYTKNAFMPDHPYQLLSRGDVLHAPWLASITTQEGLFTAASFIDREEQTQQLDRDFLGIAPSLLDYNFTVPHSRMDDVSKQIRYCYLKSKIISLKTSREVVDMVGDRIFKSDMDLAVKMQAFVSPFPVYFFTFGYEGSVGLSHVMSRTKTSFGVSHYDDIYYILNQADSSGLITESDKAMIRSMSEIWASFINIGQPPPSLAALWRPVSRDSLLTGNLTHLYIKAPDDVTLRTDSNLGNHKFWRSLEFEENSSYRRGEHLP